MGTSFLLRDFCQRERRITRAMSNSFGFGGHNATLVLIPNG